MSFNECIGALVQICHSLICIGALVQICFSMIALVHWFIGAHMSLNDCIGALVQWLIGALVQRCIIQPCIVALQMLCVLCSHGLEVGLRSVEAQKVGIRCAQTNGQDSRCQEEETGEA